MTQSMETVVARVRSIVRDGTQATNPCVLLVEEAHGGLFEVWLAYSSVAVSAANNVRIGSDVSVDGRWASPVCSHRAHGGLHVPYREIRFFTASKLQVLEGAAV